MPLVYFKVLQILTLVFLCGGVLSVTDTKMFDISGHESWPLINNSHTRSSNEDQTCDVAKL